MNDACSLIELDRGESFYKVSYRLASSSHLVTQVWSRNTATVEGLVLGLVLTHPIDTPCGRKPVYPEKTYNSSMILPTLTYCGILQLKLSPTQLTRLASFHDRAVKIVSTGNSVIPTELPSVIQCNRKRACEIVRKCLVKGISSLFHNYFTIINHEKKTRNNDCLLRLPKIRTEYARKSFFFMGAKVYNDLPAEIRKTENHQNFLKLLEDHF